MKSSKELLKVVSLLIFAMILVRFLPMKTNEHTATESFSINVSDFKNGAVDKRFVQEKPRLITVENFRASKLNNTRDIYVYLPPSYYEDTSKKYPVLYVQDGKGVFYLSDWSKESLNMDKIADELINKGSIEEIIVVGISNMGNERDSEFAHWDGIDRGRFIEAKGALYEDFLINDVKPFVEKNFRIKQGRENTAIMGASLGGFVSLNIGLRHPDVFSKIALQSPYLGWGEEKLLEEIREGAYKDKRDLMIWMDMGARENEFMDVMRRAIMAFHKQGYKPVEEIAILEFPEGKHSEGSWSQRVDDILIYFYGRTGNPVDVQLTTNDKVSISSQANGVYRHMNPMVTYDNGMTITDFTGSYWIDDEGIAEIDGFGTIIAKQPGKVNITYKTSTGLSRTSQIEIYK
ncbi:MAG: esterase [Anaerosolibacter sp.]|jgi:enterochelin esterase-like enzyme|uniref:alpha/beta hydrolase-fold protein n=1 Tax=Anaerosolibacter sp. TaxID=1872527 RepID=UPI00261185C2|nr:alpha/beta hydrolase-fold protein [Anaerosolibacter sp.]MDF2545137.1 esterase [Anaerosolibacter sp.]